MYPPISSRNHEAAKRIKRLARRSYREKDGLFLVEGFGLVQEGLDSGARLRELVYVDSRVGEVDFLRSRCREAPVFHLVSPSLMEWLSDVVTSQGVMGVFEQPPGSYQQITRGGVDLLLIADQVRDPGNLGSLFRIADAVGAGGMVMTRGCVDAYNPKVVRAASGAHFRVPHAGGVELATLKEDLGGGVRLLGLDARGDRSYLDVDYREPVALVVGNEAFGITEADAGLIDDTVSIRMPGKAESLNVASAAAVVLFEAIRQRG